MANWWITREIEKKRIIQFQAQSMIIVNSLNVLNYILLQVLSSFLINTNSLLMKEN
jgi:hypothetical protein